MGLEEAVGQREGSGRRHIERLDWNARGRSARNCSVATGHSNTDSITTGYFGLVIHIIRRLRGRVTSSLFGLRVHLLHGRHIIVSCSVRCTLSVTPVQCTVSIGVRAQLEIKGGGVMLIGVHAQLGEP